MHFLFLALVISGFAYAQEEYNCNFDGVKSVKTKLYPQSERIFDFKYQVVGNIDPEKFVIISIPGGPGGSSINDYKDEAVQTCKQYPKNGSRLPTIKMAFCIKCNE